MRGVSRDVEVCTQVTCNAFLFQPTRFLPALRSLPE
jgi:hypothetical protein